MGINSRLEIVWRIRAVVRDVRVKSPVGSVLFFLFLCLPPLRPLFRSFFRFVFRVPSLYRLILTLVSVD